MTPEPEIKAKELVDKYLESKDNIEFDNGCSIGIYQAKQCALICCDEVIKTLDYDEPFEYWQEVKQEINKL